MRKLFGIDCFYLLLPFIMCLMVSLIFDIVILYIIVKDGIIWIYNNWFNQRIIAGIGIFYFLFCHLIMIIGLRYKVWYL